MSQLLISNARIFNPGGSPALIEDGYILIDGETIKEVGSGRPEVVKGQYHEIDLQLKTVLPGMINAHTHLYSSLALGMPPPEQPPRNFPEILAGIWWKLDRALDEESTRASFESGMIASLKAGVTTIIDHHSSQNYIKGSLDQLAESANHPGVNISLCFETTDRNGPECFKAGLQENLEAVNRYSTNHYIRPLMGMHASFTLSDASLAQIREAVGGIKNRGIHIHISEDVSDELDAKEKGYPSVVQRLMNFELVNSHSILVHGLHITKEDRQIIGESGAALVHNPSSNANNRVGILSTGTIQALQPGLGTDGMKANMLVEAREGGLIRSAQAGDDEPNVNYLELLFLRNAEIATRLFGHPIGRIESGYQADLAVYDYHPRTEVHSANLASHILNGLPHPCHVLTRGEFRVKDYMLVQVDEEKAATRARAAASRLWEAMQKI